ncbi:MAG TPA: DUF5615 family PIN-like protein [Nitriliruptorales bacterium]
MRFLIDAMLPPHTCDLLVDRDHEAVTPADLGAHNLPDDTLIEIAGADEWVVVTENAVDFARVTSCTVLLVRKGWWSNEALAACLADSLNRWADDHPKPGHWAHWLDSTYR